MFGLNNLLLLKLLVLFTTFISRIFIHPFKSTLAIFLYFSHFASYPASLDIDQENVETKKCLALRHNKNIVSHPSIPMKGSSTHRSNFINKASTSVDLDDLQWLESLSQPLRYTPQVQRHNLASRSLSK